MKDFRDWTPEMVEAYNAKVKGVNLPVEAQTLSEKGKTKGKQTKTEIEAGNMLKMEFPDSNIIPWGLTLRMGNNHKYTPDYLVQPVNGKMLLVEVKQRGKNGFRQYSYQRAKLAFNQCKVEYNLFKYRWMEKHNGEWEIHDYE